MVFILPHPRTRGTASPLTQPHLATPSNCTVVEVCASPAMLVSMEKIKKPAYLELHWQVLSALVLGVFCGILAPELSLKLGFLGDLFLRALKMIIIPLIFLSLVDGVAGIRDAGKLGRMGISTMVYYTLSTAMAIVTGIAVVNLIRLGVGLHLGDAATLPEGFAPVSGGLGQFLMRLLPENIFHAAAEGAVLPVITFALLVGIFLARLDSSESRMLIGVLKGGLEVIQSLTLAIISLAPIGIFALLAREVARSGLGVFKELAWYFLAVGLGLCLHFFVTLPLILRYFGRVSPRAHFRAALPALATAFSTASSSATLPLTMECAEKRAGMPAPVASFVLPLGATVNMDGTALYEAVAALCIAQMYGVHLGLMQQGVVLLTSLLASVGAAGIPMAGLVMLVVVLQAVGLPIEGIATILAVDRVLDMMRTATNVWSDFVGTAVVARWSGFMAPGKEKR